MKGKMAIIGDGDSVMSFKAGGIDAYPVNHVERAKDTLRKLAKQYQIIFVTDVIAKEMDDTIKRYLNMPYPVIISVPSGKGSNGYGMECLKKAMDKALGVDILFNQENDD